MFSIYKGGIYIFSPIRPEGHYEVGERVKFPQACHSMLTNNTQHIVVVVYIFHSNDGSVLGVNKTTPPTTRNILHLTSWTGVILLLFLFPPARLEWSDVTEEVTLFQGI